MFCSKGFPKVTYLYGYGPLNIIEQQRENSDFTYGLVEELSKGVLHYNRMDILDWMLADVSDVGYVKLIILCITAMDESRLDILREVFCKANTEQLEHLRNYREDFGLCAIAVECGKLECLKLLRENECEWNKMTWYWAKRYGHDHILDYLQNNGYPTEWQVEENMF